MKPNTKMMTISSSSISAMALRFEIIKRLAPGFRHRLLGRMQPIALLSHLMGKKIQAGDKESEFLLRRLQELKESLNAATDATVDLFTWLNPDEKSVQPLNEIVEECLDLLKMDIYTSNVVFHNSIDSQALVKVTTFRNVFTACLLTYLDTTEKASQVILSAKEVAGDTVIEMTLNPTPERDNKTLEGNGTFVDWEDIHLVSEGAHIIREQRKMVISNLA